MSDGAVKSPHYVLVIDERRNDLLGCLMQAATLGGKTHVLLEKMLTFNCLTVAELAEFVKEIADKEHELNWCKDPTCTEKQAKP